MNKQKILISLMTVILTGVTVFAVPQVYAQTPGAGTHMNFFQGLLLFIEQKFGLDKTQVQSAITDYQKQWKATITPRPTLSSEQLTDKEKSRLDKLVTDGKITSDQETAIINELTVLRTKYNLGSWKDLTLAERKTQSKEMRDEIVSWAQSQGIDSSFVLPGFGMGVKGWGMGSKGMGDRGKGWGAGWNINGGSEPIQ